MNEENTKNEPEKRELLRRPIWAFQGQSAEFEERMAAGIQHPGLMIPFVQYEKGVRQYCYDLTGLLPLQEFLQKQRLSEQGLAELILQLCAMVRCMEQHLLSEQNLALSSSLALIDSQSGNLALCVVPGREEAFVAGARSFLHAILCAVDDTSTDALRLGFSLFCLSVRTDFDSRQLETVVLEQRKKNAKQFLNTEVHPEIDRGGEPEPDTGQEQTGEAVDVVEKAPGSQVEKQPDNPETMTREETQPMGAGVRMGFSLLMLTAAMVILVLLRGVAAAVRFLPVYGVLAFGVIVYFLFGIWGNR